VLGYAKKVVKSLFGEIAAPIVGKAGIRRDVDERGGEG
jgi:hypothetical protein